MTIKVRKQGIKDGWEEDTDDIVLFEDLLFILEIIRTKLISSHPDNLLANYFRIDKIQGLITQKYY